jgi:hypothetical protein
MQTTYNEKMDVAVVGQLVDCTNRRVESKFAEGAINAGSAVQIGTADDQVLTTTTEVYGVAIQHPTLTLGDDSGLAAYAEFDGVSLLTNGRIWVQVNAAVAIGDAAYYEVASDAFNATNTNVAVPGGKFVSSTTGAGLAILEIK